MTHHAGQTLAETGQIYVTHNAAETYRRHERARPEEARRELTEYLCDAVPAGQTDTGAERWRYRRGSTDLDITAIVIRDGRLAVVASVSVRSDSRAGKGRRS
jgi:hypothetical protein